MCQGVGAAQEVGRRHADLERVTSVDVQGAFHRIRERGYNNNVQINVNTVIKLVYQGTFKSTSYKHMWHRIRLTFFDVVDKPRYGRRGAAVRSVCNYDLKGDVTLRPQRDVGRPQSTRRNLDHI